jgi:hypothetical protein
MHAFATQFKQHRYIERTWPPPLDDLIASDWQWTPPSATCRLQMKDVFEKGDGTKLGYRRTLSGKRK